jgi:5-methylcytosine-specific restriction endonuclease McrA
LANLHVSKKKVLARFGGKCAYCEVPLTLRTMQRDHVLPIVRWKNVRYSFSGRHGCSHPENHNLENIVAACKKCNLDKGSMDLATWRNSLKWPKPVIFYFEKVATK